MFTYRTEHRTRASVWDRVIVPTLAFLLAMAMAGLLLYELFLAPAPPCRDPYCGCHYQHHSTR